MDAFTARIHAFRLRFRHAAPSLDGAVASSGSIMGEMSVEDEGDGFARAPGTAERGERAVEC